jgi:thymidylate synthase ThyX
MEWGKMADNQKKAASARYQTMEDVPQEVKAKLAKYFSSVGGDTFVIHGLPPELTGGALARYSRAPTSMQVTIVNEFLGADGEPSQEKGSELMDRVLNAYGDDSVGELEGIHVGFENVSQILTKAIEDRRIGGSPIEQSTRYVRYDQKDKAGKWRYLRPKEIFDAGFGKEFEAANDNAFQVYSELIDKLSEYFKKQFPEDKFEIEVNRDGQRIKTSKPGLKGPEEEKAFKIAYNFTIRCAALDVGRCVLPSSTLTQIGVYGNGRFFTNLITKMKSGELEEERLRGALLEEELKKVIPTFIKRNRHDPRFGDRNKKMRLVAEKVLPKITPKAEFVTLTEKGEYIDELVSLILFPYAKLSLPQILEAVKGMPETKKEEVLSEYTGTREQRRDRTGRSLEAGYPLVFDLVGGFAEYRDLERHRMLTQQRQLLSCDLGFIMPSEVIEVGMEARVLDVVAGMEVLNAKLKSAGLTIASQYATLFNHRVRFMFGMNMREFQHMAELRTQPAGHFSYRSMLMEMSRQVEKKYPWSKKLLGFVDYSDPGNKITRAKEQSKIAGKNLASGISSERDFIE